MASRREQVLVDIQTIGDKKLRAALRDLAKADAALRSSWLKSDKTVEELDRQLKDLARTQNRVKTLTEGVTRTKKAQTREEIKLAQAIEASNRSINRTIELETKKLRAEASIIKSRAKYNESLQYGKKLELELRRATNEGMRAQAKLNESRQAGTLANAKLNESKAKLLNARAADRKAMHAETDAQARLISAKAKETRETTRAVEARTKDRESVGKVITAYSRLYREQNRATENKAKLVTATAKQTREETRRVEAITKSKLAVAALQRAEAALSTARTKQFATSIKNAEVVQKGTRLRQAAVRETNRHREALMRLGQAQQRINAQKTKLNQLVEKGNAYIARSTRNWVKFVGIIHAARAAMWATGGLINANVRAIRESSDAIEAYTKNIELFGAKNARNIESIGKRAAQTLGLSEVAYQEVIGTMGAFLQAAGNVEEKSLEIATKITGRIADLASFYNQSIEEVRQKLTSILAGTSPRPGYALGIDTTVKSLQDFMQTLPEFAGRVFRELTLAEKQQIRFLKIMQDSNKAAGDYVRTSDNLANSWRTAVSNGLNLTKTIGDFLYPAARALVRVFNTLFTTDLQEGTANFNQHMERTSRLISEITNMKKSDFVVQYQAFLRTLQQADETGAYTASLQFIKNWRGELDKAAVAQRTLNQLRGSGSLTDTFRTSKGEEWSQFGEELLAAGTFGALGRRPWEFNAERVEAIKAEVAAIIELSEATGALDRKQKNWIQTLERILQQQGLTRDEAKEGVRLYQEEHLSLTALQVEVNEHTRFLQKEVDARRWANQQRQETLRLNSDFVFSYEMLARSGGNYADVIARVIDRAREEAERAKTLRDILKELRDEVNAWDYVQVATGGPGIGVMTAPRTTREQRLDMIHHNLALERDNQKTPTGGGGASYRPVGRPGFQHGEVVQINRGGTTWEVRWDQKANSGEGAWREVKADTDFGPFGEAGGRHGETRQYTRRSGIQDQYYWDVDRGEEGGWTTSLPESMKRDQSVSDFRGGARRRLQMMAARLRNISSSPNDIFSQSQRSLAGATADNLSGLADQVEGATYEELDELNQRVEDALGHGNDLLDALVSFFDNESKERKKEAEEQAKQLAELNKTLALIEAHSQVMKAEAEEARMERRARLAKGDYKSEEEAQLAENLRNQIGLFINQFNPNNPSWGDTAFGGGDADFFDPILKDQIRNYARAYGQDSARITGVLEFVGLDAAQVFGEVEPQ